MRKNLLAIIPSLLLITLFSGCYPTADEIGRKPEEDSYEVKEKKQEELLRRQQEVLHRQELEKQDLERQEYWYSRYKKFDPH